MILRSNSAASVDGGAKFGRVPGLRDADARSEVGRLHEDGKAEARRDRVEDRALVAAPLALQHHFVVADRQPLRGERRASSPPCPSRPPTRARRRRRRARWPARAGPARCRLRRTVREAPGTRRRGRRRRPGAVWLRRSTAPARAAGMRDERALRERGSRASAPAGAPMTSAADASCGGGRTGSTQRPSLSMRIGIASYRSRIEVLKHGRRRRERHLVLAGTAAVDDADAKLFHSTKLNTCRLRFR